MRDHSVNALQLHEQLNDAHARQHEILNEADERQKGLTHSAFKSEWTYGHEEIAIQELRKEARELVFKINGMRTILKATHVKLEV